MAKDNFFEIEDSKSMNILNLLNKEIQTNDYQDLPKGFQVSKDPKWWIFTVLSFAGIFLGIAIANFQRQVPLIEKSKQDLRISIENRVSNLASLSDRLSEINDEINNQNIQIGDVSNRGILNLNETDLQIVSGVKSITGSGFKIVINDARRTDSLDFQEVNLAKVFDSDLQLITNALWASGAQAISVNNQRITTTTAIRSAGEAILINYRPLLPPYEIVFIGNEEVSKRLVENPDFKDFQYVVTTYGLEYKIEKINNVEIPAIGIELPDIDGIRVGN
ncbi:MAG: DUF881 domain-containing protein [Candidatus Nanopelagicales bacterium]|jgi:uncharacterized protein YlxW (UPF0749 family)